MFAKFRNRGDFSSQYFKDVVLQSCLCCFLTQDGIVWCHPCFCSYVHIMSFYMDDCSSVSLILDSLIMLFLSVIFFMFLMVVVCHSFRDL